MDKLRDIPWLRRLVIFSALVSPAVIIGILSGFLSIDTQEGLTKPDAMAIETPNVLTDLIGDMIGMAIGLIAASWFLYRRPVVRSERTQHLILPLLITGAGFFSIFVALRAKYSLATVISTRPFVMEEMSAFIETQSAFLALQTMIFSAFAANFAIYRDRRGKLE